MNNVITDGRAQISGDFTRESAQTLSSQLRFGALPLSFEVQSEEQISATLGSEQLEKGLIAGVIGLFLVVLFSLYQYRGLGMVTIASLAIAGLLTYGLLVLLGTLQGRSEEHTSELQSRGQLVCRRLLEKNKKSTT